MSCKILGIVVSELGLSFSAFAAVQIKAINKKLLL